MTININEIRTKLKDNYKALREEYDQEVQRSYRKKLEALEPGQNAPQRGLTPEEKNAFGVRVGEYKKRADSILGVAANDLRKDITAAPTPEAAAYIGMLSRREHIGKLEIDSAIAAYGTNYSCHEMIREAAARNDIYINPHPVGTYMRELEQLNDINNQVFEDITQPHATMGMYEIAVDDVLGLR